MGRSGVAVGGATPAHKTRNAKHAAASAPKPAGTPPQPRSRHHRVKAALHGPRDKKHGDIEVLDLVSDATSESEESDSDSDVEILDAPFVDKEVLVLSDDDDDDNGDFLGRADEVVLSSDEEEDDSDDQVVILAQGPLNRSANAANKAATATPARFRKARDPAADLKWFTPYATAPKNQDPYPWPHKPGLYRYPMNRDSIPELPAIPPQWGLVQGKIRWRGSKANFLLQARLGDARLEHLVPYILSIGHKSFAIPSNVIRYLQANQVLATLAFSYRIQYHAPFDSLHTFADAMEAFIESLFSSDIWHNNLAALEWLVALWSPTCFPLLQADIAAYDPPPDWDGEANLDRRYSKWMKKRAKWS